MSLEQGALEFGNRDRCRVIGLASWDYNATRSWVRYVNKQTNNTLFLSILHTCFKSLSYNRKVHQQLEVLSIHIYTSSGKTILKLNTVNVDKSTILDQTIIMKQTGWVTSRRPWFIPLDIINLRNKSTHWIVKSINNLIVIWKKFPDVFTKQRSISKIILMIT